MTPLRVLVAGCGNMGSSHALAYHRMPEEFCIVGLVSRRPASRSKLNAQLGGKYAEFDDYVSALRITKPEAVCVSTYPDTHAAFAILAMKAGAHVFLEKPIATTLDDAVNVVDAAARYGRTLVVGYILQVHPSWQRFTELARSLGKPLVMRMNLNQQSFGAAWDTHQRLLESVSPIVDCGVHYLDVMCRMTQARPVRVSGVGARLTGGGSTTRANYGQLSVTFDDGSVGWYEAGWGPMMSETAYFVKDVIGPKGSVSIVAPRESNGTADISSHTNASKIRLHYAQLGMDGGFARDDEEIELPDEPTHDDLCRREQELFLRTVKGGSDSAGHLQGAVDSLRIALAADRAIAEGRTICL